MQKTLILWGGILATIMGSQNLSACMPHSPNEVFIARVQSFESDKNQTKFQFSNHNFIFRPLIAWFRYSSPNEWNGDFKIKNIKKGNLIIGNLPKKEKLNYEEFMEQSKFFFNDENVSEEDKELFFKSLQEIFLDSLKRTKK